MKFSFTKMHGTGNDYVYVDLFQQKLENQAEVAKVVSDRHFGIGADGLICIAPSETADCRMIMYNADGSEGAMCGNGIRCVGKYAYDHGIAVKNPMTVETGAGVKTLAFTVEEGKVRTVTVDMGIPEQTSRLPEPITVGEKDYEFVGISMGNPHAVYFMEEIKSLDLEEIGPAFECHKRFPHRTNTEFIRVLGRDVIEMRVWERGSGETHACGTGAAASAVAAVLMGYADDRVEVRLLGGNLDIYWNRETGHVFMTGPAEEVFQGEIDVPVSEHV